MSRCQEKSMYKNYLKIALRNFKKHFGYSIIKLSGLAIGMACCVIIFIWIQNELGFDRFHEKSDRLFRLISFMDEGWSSTSPWSLSVMLKKDFPEIEKASRFNNRRALVQYREKIFYENLGLADPDFLEMFSFPFIKGNSSTALSAKNSVIVSKTTARKYFGENEAVGKILTVNKTLQLTITGVIEDVPSKSSLQFDILAPVQLVGEQRLQSWWLETNAFVLVSKNVSVNGLRAKMAGTTMKYDKRIKDKIVKNDLQPFTRMHLYGLNDIGDILYVYIFFVIAVIVLIIACINFINLTTAKAGNRAGEIGMRKVLGAHRMNIVHQFFGESFMMSFIALLISLGLVVYFLPAFNNLTGRQLSFDLNGSITAVLIGITAVVGILSGSYPALLLSSFKPISVLQKSKASGSKNPLLRRILVIFQFTITIILIISSLVLQRQMNYIGNKDLGFDRDNVIRLSLNQEISENYQVFKNRLLQNPDILNVSAANSTPTQVGNINPVYWEGGGPDQYKTMNFVTVDYDYFETFKMDIIQGRSFSREFSTDNQNYIVNQAAVDFAGLENPIGKMFSIWEREGRIIGVVKNFHSKSLHNEIVPIVFALTRDWPHTYVFIRLNPNDVQNTLNSVKEVWSEYAGSFPFNFKFLNDVFEQQYQSDQRTKTLFGYFTFLAIFISCLGLLGLAAFAAEQRTKEIGIRKTLGASVSSLIMLISREFLILLGIANLIAWPLAFYVMKKMMNQYAYQVGITIWIFLFAGFLTLVITSVTVSFQAFRAARTNPVDSLRFE